VAILKSGDMIILPSKNISVTSLDYSLSPDADKSLFQQSRLII